MNATWKAHACLALDYPGVFTYGADDAEALIRMPRQILTFESWLNLHTDQTWVQIEGLDMHVEETFEVFPVEVDGSTHEVIAFFRSDLVPLSEEEIRRALGIYNWQREELLAGVETLPAEMLERAFEGQSGRLRVSWSTSPGLSHGTFRAWGLRSQSMIKTVMPSNCSMPALK